MSCSSGTVCTHFLPLFVEKEWGQGRTLLHHSDWSSQLVADERTFLSGRLSVFNQTVQCWRCKNSIEHQKLT